jgi:hypothetical protein
MPLAGRQTTRKEDLRCAFERLGATPSPEATVDLLGLVVRPRREVHALAAREDLLEAVAAVWPSPSRPAIS